MAFRAQSRAAQETDHGQLNGFSQRLVQRLERRQPWTDRRALPYFSCATGTRPSRQTHAMTPAAVRRYGSVVRSTATVCVNRPVSSTCLGVLTRKFVRSSTEKRREKSCDKAGFGPILHRYDGVPSRYRGRIRVSHSQRNLKHPQWLT